MSVYGTFCIYHYSRYVHVLTFVLLSASVSCLLSHGAVPSVVLAVAPTHSFILLRFHLRECVSVCTPAADTVLALHTHRTHCELITDALSGASVVEQPMRPAVMRLDGCIQCKQTRLK